MPVISSQVNVEALTLTFVAEFDARVEQVWQVWRDPRRLERWWGPPTWPAAFERHDFVVGGRSEYHMTGPADEKSRGWWTITAIEAPHRLEFDDGFADENGEPVTTVAPTHTTVTIEAVDARARMTTVSTFTDVAQMEQMLAMGVEEGMRSAMNQIDRVLAAERP